MEDQYSRRKFINKTGLAIAGAGTVMTLSATTNANAAGQSMMAEGGLDPVKFGKSLKGVGFNLLVTDVMATVAFSKDILLANIIQADDGFAIVRSNDTIWMLHSDATYHSNPLAGLVEGVEGRGRGVELRLYDIDPDAAEARAKAANYTMLANTTNKPHGLRECYILDPDGYCWVISRPLEENDT